MGNFICVFIDDGTGDAHHWVIEEVRRRKGAGLSPAEVL